MANFRMSVAALYMADKKQFGARRQAGMIDARNCASLSRFGLSG
jgi:hypothetical protein